MALFVAEIPTSDKFRMTTDARTADTLADKFARETNLQFEILTSFGGQLADKLRHD